MHMWAQADGLQRCGYHEWAQGQGFLKWLQGPKPLNLDTDCLSEGRMDRLDADRQLYGK